MSMSYLVWFDGGDCCFQLCEERWVAEAGLCDLQRNSDQRMN
jgi:hypothetical protein